MGSAAARSRRHSLLADPPDPPDLVDTGRARSARVEKVIDAVRARLGDAAILKGRALPRGRPDR